MIRNLQHFALSVPDLEAGRRFYEAFGLQAAAAEWKTKDWGPADGFFLWSTSGPPPADFVQNYEES
jgi:catechol 2,3-dioxygenase-like lactoylglutathione lyase family enzyme